jgi:hypothetical protein
LYNCKLPGGKHCQATKAKMAKAKLNNRYAFKCGSVFLNAGVKQRWPSFQFIHSSGGQVVTKSWSIGKYGYWGAKHMAEAERRRVYPIWVKDPEQEVLEELFCLSLE